MATKEASDYQHNRHSVSALHVHLVFVTKYRRKVFDDEMLTCCEQVMRQVCIELGADLREFNSEADHVHLLAFYPPKIAASTLANRLKGASSWALRPEFTGRINRARMRGHLWSPAYFAASCGGAPLSIIKQYIENQNRPI